MKGSLPPGCPIRTSAGHGAFATRRSFSQLVTSFFASESQGIPHAPLVVPLISLTSRLNDMCLFALWLLVCETLLCFYSCLLTIQNSKCNIQNFKSFPALSLFSESEIRNRKVSDPYDLPTKQSRFRKPAPERRCSSRTFRYGYLVTT